MTLWVFCVLAAFDWLAQTCIKLTLSWIQTCKKSLMLIIITRGLWKEISCGVWKHEISCRWKSRDWLEKNHPGIFTLRHPWGLNTNFVNRSQEVKFGYPPCFRPNSHTFVPENIICFWYNVRSPWYVEVWFHLPGT